MTPIIDITTSSPSTNHHHEYHIATRHERSECYGVGGEASTALVYNAITVLSYHNVTLFTCHGVATPSLLRSLFAVVNAKQRHHHIMRSEQKNIREGYGRTRRHVVVITLMPVRASSLFTRRINAYQPRRYQPRR